jgi:anti-sigma B factor antagonist
MTDLRPDNSYAFIARAAGHDGRPRTLATRILHDGNEIQIYLSGEMDLASVTPLRPEVQALFAMPIDSIVIDLSDITFLDSAGLHTLDLLRDLADEHGVTLVLRSLPPHARRLLDLSGMTGQFTVGPEATRAAAFADGFD